MNEILKIEVLLDVSSKPPRRHEAQHGCSHNYGSLNNRREQRRPFGDGEGSDDGDRHDLQRDLEQPHAPQRRAAARALRDVRPVPATTARYPIAYVSRSPQWTTVYVESMVFGDHLGPLIPLQEMILGRAWWQLVVGLWGSPANLMVAVFPEPVPEGDHHAVWRCRHVARSVPVFQSRRGKFALLQMDKYSAMR